MGLVSSSQTIMPTKGYRIMLASLNRTLGVQLFAISGINDVLINSLKQRFAVNGVEV